MAFKDDFMKKYYYSDEYTDAVERVLFLHSMNKVAQSSLLQKRNAPNANPTKNLGGGLIGK